MVWTDAIRDVDGRLWATVFIPHNPNRIAQTIKQAMRLTAGKDSEQ